MTQQNVTDAFVHRKGIQLCLLQQQMNHMMPMTETYPLYLSTSRRLQFMSSQGEDEIQMLLTIKLISKNLGNYE